MPGLEKSLSPPKPLDNCKSQEQGVLSSVFVEQEPLLRENGGENGGGEQGRGRGRERLWQY